jgi:hypothetical protein
MLAVRLSRFAVQDLLCRILLRGILKRGDELLSRPHEIAI